MTATRTRAGEANERLTRALISLAARGQRPRCGDYETSWMWLDEDPHIRAQAALLCHDCPVIVECGDAADANDERHFVWGGRDYTRQRKAAA